MMHYKDILKFPNLRLIHSLRIQSLQFYLRRNTKNLVIFYIEENIFYYKKMFKYVFDENTDQFFICKKIQICI